MAAGAAGGQASAGGSGALALQLALGAFLLLAIAWPMADLLRRALGDGDLAASPLATALRDPFARRVLWNTLLLGAALAVVGTILATACAYAMTRIDVPWKPLWHFLALLPTISPPILMALGLVLLYGRRGIVTSGLLGMKTTALYGFWGLLVAQAISYFPFAYLLMLNQFRGLDASTEEAARTLGASSWQVLRTVSLPLMAPGLAASALLLFGYSFADLGNPLLLGGDFPVMSAQIYMAIIGMYDVPQGAALAILLLLPAALMFAAHKAIGARMTFAGVGARGAAAARPRGSRRARVAALCLLGGVGAIITLQYATILAGAFTQLFGINHAPTLRHFEAVLARQRGALLDTFVLGVAAAALSVAIGLLIAWVAARTRLRGRWLLDAVAAAPLAIPGTVIGLAFALAFNEKPLVLTGTAAIVVLAFVVRSLPYGVRSGVAALDQVHRSLDEASTTMGAGPAATFRRILLPLVRPALLAGMVFAFTRSVTTLSAVIFVVSPHWSLVTPAILSQMDRGDVGEAAALSVLVVLMVLAVVHGVPRLFGPDWRGVRGAGG